jgi:hypothetical protein
VRGVVVQNDVDQLTSGHLGLDRIQEMDELLMAMPLHAPAADTALQHVEGRKQRVVVLLRLWSCIMVPCRLFSSTAQAGCGQAPGFGLCELLAPTVAMAQSWTMRFLLQRYGDTTDR